MRKVLYIAVLLLYSCSKDSNSSSNQNNADLLVNKKWKLTFENAKLVNGTTTGDTYPSLEDYKQDDYYFFKPDLSWAIHDNALKHPNASSDTLDFGTWSLTNGDQDLHLTSTAPLPPGFTIIYFPTKILELTTNTMKWESTNTSDGTIIWTNYKVIP